MDPKPELGRDELNLAEFPLGMLADRYPAEIKTLIRECRDGTMTITGSDAYGLPTPLDTDILIALLHLTKVKNDFTERTVAFSRYEIMGLIGTQKGGRGYKRIEDSLRRWVGVSLHFQGTWWDNALKAKVNSSFHILDEVTVYDDGLRRTLRSRQQPLPISSFTWGRTFFESCQASNLKRLDLAVYFGLRSAISKQLYRFLDKRFYVRREWTFGLRELAFAHVGLSQSYSDSKIKEKLRAALEELKEIGFVRSAEFFSPRRGDWRIRFTAG